MGIVNRNATAKKEVEIVNRLGLHARPCSKFVKLASTFKAEIWVSKDDESVNGKSIMGLMMLAAGPGSKLHISARGQDATRALVELEELMQRKFDEE